MKKKTSQPGSRWRDAAGRHTPFIEEECITRFAHALDQLAVALAGKMRDQNAGDWGAPTKDPERSSLAFAWLSRIVVDTLESSKPETRSRKAKKFDRPEPDDRKVLATAARRLAAATTRFPRDTKEALAFTVGAIGPPITPKWHELVRARPMGDLIVRMRMARPVSPSEFGRALEAFAAAIETPHAKANKGGHVGGPGAVVQLAGRIAKHIRAATSDRQGKLPRGAVESIATFVGIALNLPTDDARLQPAVLSKRLADHSLGER